MIRARGRRSRLAAVTAAAALGVGAGLLPVALPGTAQAASYRYWTYWTSTNGTWTFAQQGAGTLRPRDGDVQGWRFAVTAGAGAPASRPRVAPSFAALCAGEAQTSGTRRVGLVVDFGTAADAPPGEAPRATIATCVRIGDGGTGLDVLAAGTSAIRLDDGLVCGIDGFPRRECAVVVEDRPVAAPSRTTAPRPAAASPRSTGAQPAPGARDDASDAQPSAASTAPGATQAAEPAGASATSGSASSRGSDAPSPAARAAAAAQEPVEQGGTPLGALAALALVAAAGGTALVLRRRRG